VSGHSTAALLREVATMLRTLDEGMLQLAELLEEPPASTEMAQGDLLIIASWLEEHPEIDAEIHALLALGFG
jgi:hypothetical protein